MTSDAVADLQRAFAAVGGLIDRIGPEQWPAPTPCSEWNVRQVVDHLIGLNRLMTAQLGGDPVPDGRPSDDPVGDYRTSSAELVAVFAAPGMLEKVFPSSFGDLLGEMRLRVRLADLLTHGWDLFRATGIRADIPEDLAEESLALVQRQMVGAARGGRFGDPQPVADDAPALDRLAAFTGRSV
ncbi:TIGR03086 family metal-binding protein [Nocardia alni]|uniref:TIGR03086 family metal-binding protein n=1 Tax=Nocardia alni TaxID=2815723 RepID=UPI001C229A29|nr:TIGR03086 family metal-binding protein [Nocardia alni]